MKKAIQKQKNDVFVIETRRDLYVLAQSLGNNTLVFFNYFSEDLQRFNDVDLKNVNLLCCITPVRQFFQKCNMVRIKINPLMDIDHYKERNRLAFELMATLKEYKIYEGTDDEIIFMYRKGVLRLVNHKLERIKSLDTIADKEIIENHQWDTMGVYGELNEKLYLSYKYGKYVEPIKDLIIGKKLPIEYKTYFLMCAGKMTEEEWLKLSNKK
jgi:hypothetical protein